jgi:hypothetical protein
MTRRPRMAPWRQRLRQHLRSLGLVESDLQAAELLRRTGAEYTQVCASLNAVLELPFEIGGDHGEVRDSLALFLEADRLHRELELLRLAWPDLPGALPPSPPLPHDITVATLLSEARRIMLPRRVEGESADVRRAKCRAYAIVYAARRYRVTRYADQSQLSPRLRQLLRNLGRTMKRKVKNAQTKSIVLVPPRGRSEIPPRQTS